MLHQIRYTYASFSNNYLFPVSIASWQNKINISYNVKNEKQPQGINIFLAQTPIILQGSAH